MTVALNTGSNADTSATPSPEGHEAAMIAKVDGQNTPATPAPAATAPERPAWLPEKFTSAEDLAKAYTELEKKQGSAAPAATPPAKPDATGTEIPQTTDQARQTVENAGLNFDEINSEFAKDGQLSDATYEKLAKSGINRQVADSYIAGQQALASQLRTEVFNVAGSEEAYTDMVAWAKDSLSPQEITAYNKAMNSRDVATMKLAVDGLKSRFTAANGSAPKLVGGSSGNAGQAQGAVFRSTAELTTAMKDPRYATDPAYRQDVQDRLARSNIM